MDNTITKIIYINTALAKFWSNAHGWVPKEAAELMSKSRLDRQVSLSHCLRRWFKNITEASKEGSLILAWANLGSLIEGTLKLFLAVYYKDYKTDIDALKHKTGEIKDPDILALEELKTFFIKKHILDDKWIKYIEYVQQKRNAIHAFKDRDIGSYGDLRKCVEKYLEVLQQINSRLPYPDDIYEPQDA
jgi:hypothetical protein